MLIQNDRGIPLVDLDGISGGPIFGVKLLPGHEMEWRLFGIQSAWLPFKRILRGVGTGTMLDLMRSDS